MFYGNWRGIIKYVVRFRDKNNFCRKLLNRIKENVDKILRMEQAGLRYHHAKMSYLFVLRTVVELSNIIVELITENRFFIDFQKAFDSVHHPSPWTILTEYDKIIPVIS